MKDHDELQHLLLKIRHLTYAQGKEITIGFLQTPKRSPPSNVVFTFPDTIPHHTIAVSPNAGSEIGNLDFNNGELFD